MPEVAAIRDAMLRALPVDTSYSGAAPPLPLLYLPPAHIKALRPECQLVIGARGVGKSVWTAALGDSNLRRVVGTQVAVLDKADIRIGFAERSDPDAYPDPDIFSDLLQQGHEPYQVWRTVIVRWLSVSVDAGMPIQSWRASAAWFRDNPEAISRLMQQASKHLESSNGYGLILFDALDRLSNDWSVMDRGVRDLLRAVLWLKPYPALSAKVFLREDQMKRTVTDFPDASKLLATKQELSWERHDLHGLLWQHLLNAQGAAGEHLRAIYQSVLKAEPKKSLDRFSLHDEAQRETATQRALFNALAGPWMGRDRRRGVPYTWTPSHLADGVGRTSPRSFLAAIRQAAEDSTERYPEYGYALHYESIKRGVQKASEIRIAELAEDYPWVQLYLQPLQGITVPVLFQEIERRWADRYPNGPLDAVAGVESGLPPQHVEQGWNGVVEDLIRVGIFERRRDGRIDLPDLFRVGFGLGRRGGVKPKV